MDKPENKLKFYQFQHSDGNDIMVAEYGRQAMDYYMNIYQDDLNIDDMMETGGLRIRELTEQEIDRKRDIYNEEKNETESLSFREVAKEIRTIPEVIITPKY